MNNTPRNPMPPGQQYQFYTRVDEILHPSDLFVWVDEDPITIDNGDFRLDLDQFNTFNNAPSAMHSQSSAIGFADGHVELHRWKQVQTVVNASFAGPIVRPSNNTADVTWLKTRATEPQ